MAKSKTFWFNGKECTFLRYTKNKKAFWYNNGVNDNNVMTIAYYKAMPVSMPLSTHEIGLLTKGR